MENLALFGGEKTKQTPFGTGKRFGEEELEQLREALEQNTLFYWYGNKVKEMNRKFAAMYGVPHCVATSSGTAAIHAALGALGVTAGDEVIVPPITDMGTIIGVLYQNAIPIFADLDPYSYHMTAETIEEKITDKTKAVIVVHLAGNTADMDPILELARKRDLKIIEDCAQSYLSYYKGKLAGTMGDAGCFSLNDFKHISAGDGGMVLLKDEALYEKTLRFVDKNYNRLAGASLRDVGFLAPNYRMTELQGAVALAQLDKLESICAKRREYGDGITEGIRELPGIIPAKTPVGGQSSYWFYMFRIDAAKAGVDRDQFCGALTAEGIPCMPGYIPACVYEYNLLTEKNIYPGTDCPFGCKYYGRKIEYRKGLCPNAEEILQTSVRLPVSEFYTEQDRKDVVSAIRKVSGYFQPRA